MMFTAVLLPLLAAEPAHAWRHTRKVWDREAFPLDWYMSNTSEDSLPEGADVEILKKSWAHWVDDAACADLSTNFNEDDIRPATGYEFDGYNTFYFDDPADEVTTGVLGATLTLGEGQVAFNLSGETYVLATDSDIIFNNDIDWATDAQIDAGCSGEYSLEAVATHEIGHLWGMDHTCEEGESCYDLDKRYATMYWSIGPCSTYQSILKSEDIEGITALYGPYASFFSDSQRSGGAPLTVCFQLEMDEENEGVDIQWNFGDGSIVDDIADEVCHTYTEAGQYTVNMQVTGTQEQCGEWEFTQRELAYVTVCEAPQPADGFQGMFTYEQAEEDLTLQMINQVDTSVYGCVERIQWDVFEGNGNEPIQSVSAWSPKIAFPEAGDYRVVLNVGAPGDLFAAEELTVTVDETPGGCATAPGTGGVAGMLVGIIGLLIRRRRD